VLATTIDAEVCPDVDILQAYQQFPEGYQTQ
jgi:hypothetical protein